MPSRSEDSFSVSANESEEYEDDSDLENAAGTAAGPSSRLSRLKKPKIGNHYHRPAKEKKKGSGRIRYMGKLAELVNMPLDVFFEITGWLQPLDILQLSRVSKHFRSMFASPKSRHIWVASRRNMNSMPDCPPDLSEPQYASLMFEHHCQACGTSRAQKTDYALRVRFCGSCFKENVQKGSTLMKPYRKIPDIILTLLPRSMLKAPGVYQAGHRGSIVGFTFESSDNGRQNAYYAPELELVVKRYRNLESDPAALKTFMDTQKAIAAQMMEDATALNEWVLSSKSLKANEDSERADRRQASIETKLSELGWDRRYFPTMYDPEWYSLVKQPRELTPRIWKIIQPKLEAVLEKRKQQEAKRARAARAAQRHIEFLPIWNEMVTSITDSQERMLMPHHDDACELPSVAAMLLEDDARIPVTEERWLAIVHTIPSQVADFQDKVKRDFVRRLKAVPKMNQWYSNQVDSKSDDNVEDGDFSILEKASSFLKCNNYECEERLTYPACLTHSHISDYKWSIALSRLRRDEPTESTFKLLLDHLKLPEDASHAEVEALNGRLVCLCGNPKIRNPMSFWEMVRHITKEVVWYNSSAKMKRVNDYSKGVDYYNDHDSANFDSFVKLLQCDDVATYGQQDSDDQPAEDASSFSSVPKYCKSCFILNNSYSNVGSDMDAAYHMKAKHHKEANDEEVMAMDALRQWKRDHSGNWW